LQGFARLIRGVSSWLTSKSSKAVKRTCRDGLCAARAGFISLRGKPRGGLASV
jgi:hypothetical protein